MLKNRFTLRARETVRPDAAVRLAEKLTYETHVAGLCLVVFGASLGLAGGAALVGYLTQGQWSCWSALNSGLVAAVAAAWRRDVAGKRIRATGAANYRI